MTFISDGRGISLFECSILRRVAGNKVDQPITIHAIAAPEVRVGKCWICFLFFFGQ